VSKKELVKFKYSLNELKQIAEDYAVNVAAPFSILLTGALGSGKTAFAKFFIEKIMIDKNQKVTSPTFNIVQIYETTKGAVWHADLYRLEKEAEIFELGLIEAANNSICIIEWPRLIKRYIANCNFIEFSLD
jgi:tRNA threonylcarbamoyl adenosine modification protein YjeE